MLSPGGNGSGGGGENGENSFEAHFDMFGRFPSEILR